MSSLKQRVGKPFPPQTQEQPGLESKMRPRPEFEGDKYQAAAKLKDKVALITGGDSGIGRTVAVLYAREGADVAIVYLPAEESDAQETKKHVESAGRKALLIAGDVSKKEFCDKAVQQTVDELGRLDILVNNAAYQQTQDSLDELEEEQWDRTFRVNIYGYFFMAKAALKHMKEGVPSSIVVRLPGYKGIRR